MVILLLAGMGRNSRRIVVSMETHATATIEPCQFSGDRSDRESELALFALEAKHGFKLSHADRCLNASWFSPWETVFTFPPAFDPAKWQSVQKRCTRWLAHSSGARHDLVGMD